MNDNDQEGYLTSNYPILDRNLSKLPGKTLKQSQMSILVMTSPFRVFAALRKSKSKQSLASSEAVDREDFEQAIFEAAIEESLRTAVQDRKPGQSSKVPGRTGLRCTVSQRSTIVIRQNRRMTAFLSK